MPYILWVYPVGPEASVEDAARNILRDGYLLNYGLLESPTVLIQVEHPYTFE